MEKYNLIILIPSHNDIESLKKIIVQINEKFKVIVADDCSNDNTSEWLKKNKIEYIKNPERLGYTLNLINAFRILIKRFPYIDYILTMDADGEHNTSNLDMINSLIINNSDINLFLGVRNKKNRLSEIIISILFYLRFKIKDPVSGFRIYDKLFLTSIIDKLSSQYFLIDVIYYAKKYNFKIHQFNIKVSKRNGSSRVGNFFFVNLNIIKSLKYILK